ncbi:hypothetical protein VNI00_008674 [Paramarasmius palmivorus]|uniref:Uncharacterized protein n=1 Tax=Paramarasmius palmivorus TaxID=297713 RepID=A0AAW0CYT2_9AGAR
MSTPPGMLQAPDTDLVVSSVNVFAKFLGKHATIPWPAQVTGAYFGRGCHYVHCVQVPFYGPKDPYKPHIDDIVTHFWFPPFKGIQALKFDVLLKEEVTNRKVQYRAYLYPQSSKYLHVPADLNRFWFVWSKKMKKTPLKVLGPMLVVKYCPLSMTPQSIEAGEVKDIFEAISSGLFLGNSIPDEFACGTVKFL